MLVYTSFNIMQRDGDHVAWYLTSNPCSDSPSSSFVLLCANSMSYWVSVCVCTTTCVLLAPFDVSDVGALNARLEFQYAPPVGRCEVGYDSLSLYPMRRKKQGKMTDRLQTRRATAACTQSSEQETYERGERSAPRYGRKRRR
jgi:hypothetical protein